MDKIKLFCTDLDGSVINLGVFQTNGAVSQINFFTNYREDLKNNLVPPLAFASSRGIESLESLAWAFGINPYFIGENGAYVTYHDGEKYYSDIVKREGILHAMQKKNWLFNRIAEEFPMLSNFYMENFMFLSRWEGDKEEGRKIYKDLNLFILDLIPDGYFSSTGRWAEISPFRFRKKEGLYILRDYLGIPQDNNNSAFFGDGQNDLEIIKSLKYTGCPDNAEDEVKEASSFVSKYKNFDGFLDFYNHLKTDEQVI
jgi:hydroxymethylpyrimidine pyrophosphatase-like HAD family hydrolase